MAQSKPDSKPRSRKREIKGFKSIEKRIYIFCEGEKTEKEYFDRIEELITKNAVYKNSVFVKTIGLGMNTISIMDYAIEYVRKEKVRDAQVWCVFDKDDFPEVNFNAAIQRANDLNNAQKEVQYLTAWSNQCFEYWFMLHFEYYDADNDRSTYVQFLETKYKGCGQTGYLKNDINHFGILTSYGNPKNAIRYAKRRLQDLGESTPAKSKPATTVHLLVESLADYFPEDVRSKYL